MCCEAGDRLAEYFAEAQEERDRLKAELEIQVEHTGTAGRRISWWRRRWDAAIAERDAAIERAEAADRRMDGWAIAMRQANRITVDLRQ